jgi:uncharacterized RDD family membrane protein YckC
MNDDAPATFLRRLAALLIDAVVVIALASAFWVLWAMSVLGGPPETLSEIAVLAYTAQLMLPSLLAWTVILYPIVSATPILGRRSVGMRQVGIKVVRDGHPHA